MTQTTNQPAANAGQTTTNTIDKQLHETALASAREEGKQEGIKAERERIQAILGSDAATGRRDLAEHFAFGTDMASEAAVAALEKAPKLPEATTKTDCLSQAMANTPRPNIAPDTPEAELGAFEEGSLLVNEIGISNVIRTSLTEKSFTTLVLRFTLAGQRQLTSTVREES
uniref:Uncharacterized protein n=1 Tax=Candidatus Kentrum eta TaxID=2126337 RepID=A0A450UG47_9GAMM|nr:MAG: hypothetical protein BECKH772A_GA0070896_1003221 [Candidatus Kentron sp. H]VFJ92562.1 MAG: hypothetical protein BECKH772B_GA0070898_1003113 [Candidatus Kentron sp. H]VFJ99397.1 MAG: hypothetical protein BECKH772C_GA0070978_1003122 [Candidatus Kentron sp. H]